MASRQELALKVEERPAGFFWVLLEACDMQGSDVFHYRMLRAVFDRRVQVREVQGQWVALPQA